MTERLFSTYQIAKLLGTTLSSVAQWMDKGSLSFCSMPDGAIRITESALIKFLTEQGIDLGVMLAQAGLEKTATAGGTSHLLPQTVSVETVDDLPPEQPPAIEIPTTDEPPEETSATQPAETVWSNLQAEQICDAILSDAARQGAQTIHLTPHRDSLVLQLRIDGILRDKFNFDRHLPSDLRREIIACLLNRAAPAIDPATLALPHNAEFTRRIDGQDLALRLSAVPTACGTRLVIHMPRPAADIELLALEDAPRARLEELLQADGLIVVASKRRTGRDLTLHALLNAADTDARSVITIEQNPGADLENIAQIRIDPAAGLTCATATAALEHQDADTIVLTELRDPTTAFKAFDAAHDGALVIAGINANSASEAITELLAMGIEPWPLGGTLRAIVEQSGRPDRTAPASVTFVEGQLAEVIRHSGTAAQRDQAIAQTRTDA